jgi:hypothetical protein
MIITSRFIGDAKRSDVIWESNCLKAVYKYTGSEGNKPNKGWTTMVSKGFSESTMR